MDSKTSVQNGDVNVGGGTKRPRKEEVDAVDDYCVGKETTPGAPGVRFKDG